MSFLDIKHVAIAAWQPWDAKTIDITMSYAFRLALQQSQRTLYT
jgi:hypothetical protein